MSAEMITLTDDTFEATVSGTDKPMLVDFWAEWAGPCKLTGPILEEIAVEYADRLILAKHNIDQQPQTAPRYEIEAIPTLLLFKEGRVTGTKVGAFSKGQLIEFLDAHL